MLSSYFPITDEEESLLPNQFVLPESGRVMGEPAGDRDDSLPAAEEVKEEPDADRDTDDGTVIALPVADRVADAKVIRAMLGENVNTFC